MIFRGSGTMNDLFTIQFYCVLTFGLSLLLLSTFVHWDRNLLFSDRHDRQTIVWEVQTHDTGLNQLWTGSDLLCSVQIQCKVKVTKAAEWTSAPLTNRLLQGGIGCDLHWHTDGNAVEPESLTLVFRSVLGNHYPLSGCFLTNLLSIWMRENFCR